MKQQMTSATRSTASYLSLYEVGECVTIPSPQAIRRSNRLGQYAGIVSSVHTMQTHRALTTRQRMWILQGIRFDSLDLYGSDLPASVQHRDNDLTSNGLYILVRPRSLLPSSIQPTTVSAEIGACLRLSLGVLAGVPSALSIRLDPGTASVLDLGSGRVP
jgi:hypothetical protein